MCAARRISCQETAQIPKSPSSIPVPLPCRCAVASCSCSDCSTRYPAQTTFVYFNLACGRQQLAVLGSGFHCVDSQSDQQPQPLPQSLPQSQPAAIWQAASRPAAFNNCFRFCRCFTLTRILAPECSRLRSTCHFLCEFASRLCSLPHNAAPVAFALGLALALAVAYHIKWRVSNLINFYLF